MILYSTARIKEISLFTFLILSLFSCKKDTQSVGAEFVARNAFEITFCDTFSLNAYTVQMDSIISSRLTANALGVINDPYLGISRATLVTQYGLPGNEFTWGGATKLDSVVLQL